MWEYKFEIKHFSTKTKYVFIWNRIQTCVMIWNNRGMAGDIFRNLSANLSLYITCTILTFTFYQIILYLNSSYRWGIIFSYFVVTGGREGGGGGICLNVCAYGGSHSWGD